MTATADPVHRPTAPGSLAAVAAAVAAVALLVDGTGQWQALLVELVGLALCAGGFVAWQRDSRVGGAIAAATGVALVFLGLVLGASQPETTTQRLELLPGLLGLAVLLAGLLPVRSGWERPLVTAGTALVFVTVVTSGVVRGASEVQLLLAGVATVLAWDLGEQAVSLGKQVGRRARTRRAELAHGAGTLVAGAAVLVAALGVAALDVSGLSLTGFVALLIAAFALVVAIRH
jgi:hypothetical protein